MVWVSVRVWIRAKVMVRFRFRFIHYFIHLLSLTVYPRIGVSTFYIHLCGSLTAYPRIRVSTFYIHL